MKKLFVWFLVCTMLVCACAVGEETVGSDDSEWLTFLLMCNAGARNEGSNVANTVMVVSVNASMGKIKQMMFTWDTFIDYEGYDVPQLMEMPFRNGGPEETMKVFNQNFNLNIDRFLSVNYLNLASMIESFGGVDVDITRAERNALNNMIVSKVDTLKNSTDVALSETLVEILSSETYLEDFGIDTHLNGLQAVGYGWLQYDSVYNCCNREISVISNLFMKVSDTLIDKILFYDNDTADDLPEDDTRRKINLDSMTEEDEAYLTDFVSPIFDMSYNNLTEDEILEISKAFAVISYYADNQGGDLLDNIEMRILPLEATEPYETIVGIEGHVIDKEANEKTIKEFLYGEA